MADVTELEAEVARLQHKLDEHDRIINGLIKAGACNCKKTWAGSLIEECHWCWARRQIEKLRYVEKQP